MNQKSENKKATDSMTESSKIVQSKDINGQNRLFGGRLMEWIDIVAGVTARRHCGMNVTTAMVDSLEFGAPAYANDTIVLIGTVVYTGTTSMEVCVKTYIEKLNGDRKLINRASLIMVALDENEKPARIPQLLCETEEEEYEFLQACHRAQMRKKRRSTL